MRLPFRPTAPLRALRPLALGLALLAGSLAAHAGALFIDVSGQVSDDVQGASGNAVQTLVLQPGAYLTRLSWSLDLSAFAPSWLSELTLAFTNSAGEGFAFSPADGLNQAGSLHLDGTVDLVNSGVGLHLLADGVLNLEYFDAVDDLAGAADGRWDAGTLRVDFVPEPAGLLLTAVALAALAATRRRRPAWPAATRPASTGTATATAG